MGITGNQNMSPQIMLLLHKKKLSPPSYQRRGVDFLLLETTLDSYQPRDGARGISKQTLISPIYLSFQSAALGTLKPFPLSCHFSTNV